MSLTVGITGGIGSGKSLVCEVFELLKVPVYNADSAAKRLMAEDEDLQRQLVDVFGAEVYKEGTLDRAYLADIVFNDKTQLERLNSIVHPAVATDWENWCKAHSESPYVIKEAAILLETGGRENTDFIVLVTAPEEVRVQRVIGRDATNREAVQARMAKQWSDEKKRTFSDAVVINDGNSMVLPQVLEIHQKLLALCGTV